MVTAYDYPSAVHVGGFTQQQHPPKMQGMHFLNIHFQNSWLPDDDDDSISSSCQKHRKILSCCHAAIPLELVIVIHDLVEKSLFT